MTRQPGKDRDPIELYKEAMDHRYDPGYWASTGRWIYQPFFKPQNLPARKRAGAILSIVGLGLMLAAFQFPPYYWRIVGFGAAVTLLAWVVGRRRDKRSKR